MMKDENSFYEKKNCKKCEYSNFYATMIEDEFETIYTCSIKPKTCPYKREYKKEVVI